MDRDRVSPSLRRRQLFALLAGGLGLGASLVAAKASTQASSALANQAPPASARPLVAQAPASQSPTKLRWLATADSGSGDGKQQAVADQMATVQRRHPVDLVILAGDNIYNNGEMSRVDVAFTRPYSALLQAGVPFHAVLGNHDIRTANGDPQVTYRPFGMAGRWYNLRRGPVEFFMLDTNVNANWGRQLPWLRSSLAASKAPWKVVVGHHPIYSAGLYGNDADAQARLAPLFKKFGVQLYINGHEHDYERTKVIEGTTYLTLGIGGASLRPILANGNTAACASVHGFVELEASPTTIKINAWDRQGKPIDQALLTTKG
ncbi:MAG: metallophosphoesterase [Cyanobacteria bacterium]|nr:metallophosphoesterase [Cyanobacteriota bacterium]